MIRVGESGDALVATPYSCVLDISFWYSHSIWLVKEYSDRHVTDDNKLYFFTYNHPADVQLSNVDTRAPYLNQIL